MTDEVAEADRDGGVLTLATSIEAALRENGYDASVVAASRDPAPVPRIELVVHGWDDGSRTLRSWIGYGAGRGTMVVDCRVILSEGAAPVFTGRIRGTVLHGQEGGQDTDSAEAAGREIAGTLLDP